VLDKHQHYNPSYTLMDDRRNSDSFIALWFFQPVSAPKFPFPAIYIDIIVISRLQI